MNNLNDVAEAMCDTLSGIGLRMHAAVPHKIEPPAGIVQLGQGRNHADMDGGREVMWRVTVMLSRADDVRAQRTLYDFLSEDAAILAAFDADPTLGGTVDSARYLGWDEPGPFDLAGTSYVGANLDVETIG